MLHHVITCDVVCRLEGRSAGAAAARHTQSKATWVLEQVGLTAMKLCGVTCYVCVFSKCGGTRHAKQGRLKFTSLGALSCSATVCHIIDVLVVWVLCYRGAWSLSLCPVGSCMLFC
jgi:hypothetical protein